MKKRKGTYLSVFSYIVYNSITIIDYIIVIVRFFEDSIL